VWGIRKGNRDIEGGKGRHLSETYGPVVNLFGLEEDTRAGGSRRKKEFKKAAETSAKRFHRKQ